MKSAVRFRSFVLCLGFVGTVGCDGDPTGPQELQLQGVVLNTLDRPLPGAVVRVEVQVPGEPAVVVGTAQAAADGTFAMTLPKAEGYAFVNCFVYWLSVELEGYQTTFGRLSSLIGEDDCDAGSAVLSVVLERVPRPAAPLAVLLVVEAVTEDEAFLLDLLAWAGHHVAYQLVSNVDPDQDFSATDVVVISPEVASMTAAYRDAQVGMVVLRGSLWASYGFAASGAAGDPATNITVAAPGHAVAVAAGLVAGDNPVFGGGGSVLWRAAEPGSGADLIAWQGTEAEHVLFTYEGGATLADGGTAAARRAAFGPAVLTALTPGGEELLLAVIEWAAEVP